MVEARGPERDHEPEIDHRWHLSCPLSNSILEGSSGASVTNGRSPNETIMYTRRLKAIAGGQRARVSLGIRSLIAAGREKGDDYRVYYVLEFFIPASGNRWSKSRIPYFRWLGSVNCLFDSRAMTKGRVIDRFIETSPIYCTRKVLSPALAKYFPPSRPRINV